MAPPFSMYDPSIPKSQSAATETRLTSTIKKIYGRDTELEKLQQIYKATTTPNQARQLVFVGGVSGTGKSTLIRHALATQISWFGHGRFEERYNPNPFSALKNAFSEIAHKVVSSPDKSQYVSRLYHILTEEDVENLVSFCSDLKPLFPRKMDRRLSNGTDRRMSNGRDRRMSNGTHVSNGSNGTRTNRVYTEKTNVLERLAFSMKIFFQTLASSEVPVVLALYDLQWIDAASLTLIRSFISSREIRNFLLIGSYDDLEMDTEHGLVQWMQSIIDGPPIILHLKDLSFRALSDALSEVLKLNNVHDLAQLIHRRSGGNILKVLQLLDSMQEEKLITEESRVEDSSLPPEWKWDKEAVQKLLFQPDDPRGAVAARLARLSDDCKRALHLAAHFGFSFPEDAFNWVVDVSGWKPEIGLAQVYDTPQTRLDILVDKGLLERLPNQQLKFFHHEVHKESLVMLSKETDPNQLHWEIGNALWGEWHAESFSAVENELILLAADQLNLGRVHMADDSSLSGKLVLLNQEAATRCAKFSAFFPAAKYLRTALPLLESETAWGDNYNLTLGLYTDLADMCLASGQLQSIPALLEVVRREAKSLEDKLPIELAALSRLKLLNEMEKYEESSLSLLRECGVSLSGTPSMFSVTGQVWMTRLKLGRLTDEEVLKLPLTQDPVKSMIVYLSAELVVCLGRQGKNDGVKLVSCYATSISLDECIAQYSPLCFAFAAAFLLDDTTDMTLCFRLNSLAMKIAKRSEQHEVLFRTLAFAGGLTHWRESLETTSANMKYGYRVAMRGGDLYHALQCAHTYTYTYFFSGMVMWPLLNDLKKVLKVMIDYNQTDDALYLLPLFQCVLNLTGESDYVLDMEHGEAMDHRQVLGWDHHIGKEEQWCYSLQLFFYCEEFELCSDVFERVESLNLGNLRYSPLSHVRVFFMSLIGFHHAKSKYQAQSKRKWVRAAKQYMDLVVRWVVQHKAVNMAHRLAILEAETMTIQWLRPNEADVITAYDKAITAATESGFLQDAALAAALASRAVSEPDDKKRYADLATQFYLSWGALGVVNYLKSREDMMESFGSIESFAS